jgi:hypothetical protein
VRRRARAAIHGARAEYGDEVIDLIAQRLQARVGRGYSSNFCAWFVSFCMVRFLAFSSLLTP